MIIITLLTISSHQSNNDVFTVAPLLRRCCHCDTLLVGQELVRGAEKSALSCNKKVERRRWNYFFVGSQPELWGWVPIFVVCMWMKRGEICKKNHQTRNYFRNWVQTMAVVLFGWFWNQEIFSSKSDGMTGCALITRTCWYVYIFDTTKRFYVTTTFVFWEVVIQLLIVY